MWKKRFLSIVLAVTVLAAGPACAGDDDDPGPGTEQGGDGGGGLDY